VGNCYISSDEGSYIEFIGKGSKLGRVYLNDKALKVVAQFVEMNNGENESLIFYNSAFNKFDYAYVNKWFKRLFVDMGRTDMTIHCLRATVATILCKKAGIVVASKVLRHSNTSTTSRYVTVDESEKVSAMSLL
jgi:site-specific recombinase XerD